MFIGTKLFFETKVLSELLEYPSAISEGRERERETERERGRAKEGEREREREGGRERERVVICVYLHSDIHHSTILHYFKKADLSSTSSFPDNNSALPWHSTRCIYQRERRFGACAVV